MAIKSHVKDIPTAKARFKREIALISGGYVDRTAFPEGKITVFPWGNDAEEFIVAKSRGKKKQNIVFDLFPKLCDLNGCNPDSFLAGEALLVLMISRAITRNSVISLNLTCPECDHSWVQEVIVPDNLEKIGEKPENYPGYDTFQLKESEDFVLMRPLTVGDQKDIMGRPAHLRIIPDHIAELLTAVQSVASTEEEVISGQFKADSALELYEWYQRLSPMDASALGKKLYEITPQLSGKLTVECPECKHEFIREIDINEEFFRPNG